MTEAEQIMKKCQTGTRNYEEANNLHAACYGIIGKLSAQLKEALAKEKTLQALHSENERLGLYKDAYAQPEQEPVAWTLLLTGEHNGLIGKAGEKFIGAPDYYQRVNVYTALPQRTWVGLTDEEVRKICVNEWGGYEQCRAIEAKLKEKNGFAEEKNT